MTAPLASMGRAGGWAMDLGTVAYMATGPRKCAPTSPDTLSVALGWARQRARLYGVAHVYRVTPTGGMRLVATVRRRCA